MRPKRVRVGLRRHSDCRHRDWWDKAATISSFTSSVVIALIGLSITYSIQRAQLRFSEAQIEIAKVKAESDRRLQEGQLTAQLVQHLISKDPSQREIAVVALRAAIPHDAFEQIALVLARSDANPDVRARAIEQLGSSTTARAVVTLANISHDSNRPVGERLLAASSSLRVAARQAVAIPDGPSTATLLLASTDAKSVAQDVTPFTSSILSGLSGDADVNRDGLVQGSELGEYVANRVALNLGKTNPQAQRPVWVTKGTSELVIGPLAALRGRYPRRSAVLVAVSSNGVGLPLISPDRDIKNTADVLRQAGFETTVLSGSASSRAAVLNALLRAAQTLKPEDLFVFYYSGSGVSSVNGNVRWLMADGPSGFLTPADVNSSLEQIHTRHKAIFVDSCYAGAITQ